MTGRWAAGVVMAIAASAHAQPAAPPAPEEHHAICFEGARGDRCRVIPLIEGGFRIGSATTVTLDVGGLYNLGDYDAVGATIGLLWYPLPRDAAGASQFGHAAAYELRYRRWLGDDVGLDVAVGGGTFGAVGEVGIEINDIVAFTVGVNSYPTPSGHDVAANFGVRVGAVPLAYWALVALSFL